MPGLTSTPIVAARRWRTTPSWASSGGDRATRPSRWRDGSSPGSSAVAVSSTWPRGTNVARFSESSSAASNPPFLPRFPSSVGPTRCPGFSEPDRAAVFPGRGFSPVVRADMRLPRGTDPPHPAPKPGYAPRALTLADEALIADLMYRAYSDSPERAIFATTLDQREDARRGTRGLLHGEVGRWLPDASFGIEEGGRLIAHTLANELEGGLISEVGVDPSYRRQGLARRLLPLTIGALRSAGFEVPRLVVTMWNAGAVRLYQSTGFEFVPARRGSSLAGPPGARGHTAASRERVIGGQSVYITGSDGPFGPVPGGGRSNMQKRANIERAPRVDA